MEQQIDRWDALEDLDGEALEAHMRAECEQATLAYGEALAAAGHIGDGWAAANCIDATPPWRRTAERIGGRYGVSFERMVALSSESRGPRAKVVRRARDHVFHELHRKHGLHLAAIAVLFSLRGAGGVCKAAQRHEARLAADGD